MNRHLKGATPDVESGIAVGEADELAGDRGARHGETQLGPDAARLAGGQCEAGKRR